MKITLYKNNSDRKFLQKELIEVGEIEVVIRKDFDLFRPFLLLRGIGDLDFNYIYIHELKRYYYVTNIQNITGVVYRVNFETDLLMTFPNVVMEAYAEVNRMVQEGDYYKGDLKDSYITNVEDFSSDITLEEDKIILMSTIGVK